MPTKPLKLCSWPGCGAITCTRYCDKHHKPKRSHWATAEAKKAAEARRPKGHGKYYRTAKWRAIRRSFLRYKPWCHICGKRATDVDHILPISQGGTDHPDNLESLCHSCHSRKTAIRDGGFGRT